MKLIEHSMARYSSLQSIGEFSQTRRYDISSRCRNPPDSRMLSTSAECARLLSRGTGPWAPVQDGWDVGNDESLIANGRIAGLVDADGHRQKLVANPVKFDDAAVSLTRAPRFAEHTDEVLRELGLNDDELIELKIADAVT